jgi:HEAT repeat protein
VSRKTLTNLIIVVVLIAVVWAVSVLQRSARAGALIQDLQQADDYQAYKAMRKVSGLGGSALARAVPLLSAAQPYVRARAALLVGETHDRRYAAAVEGLLQDKDASVRQAAATALGHLGAPDAVQRLTALLQDTQQPLEVRTAAARSLGLLGGPEAAAALIALLQAPPNPAEAALREAATVALGATNSREAVAELIARLQPGQEPDVVLRTLAAEALAHAVGPDSQQATLVADALIAALDVDREKATEVRIAAAHALGQVSLPPEMGDSARAALQEALNDPEYWVREAAKKALG